MHPWIGAAIYFTREGKDLCVPCDSYLDLPANIRAIGLTTGIGVLASLVLTPTILLLTPPVRRAS